MIVADSLHRVIEGQLTEFLPSANLFRPEPGGFLLPELVDSLYWWIPCPIKLWVLESQELFFNLQCKRPVKWGHQSRTRGAIIYHLPWYCL